MLVVGTGTYCDAAIAEAAMAALDRSRFRVVYLADASQVRSAPSFVERVYAYATPRFVTRDVDGGAADTAVSVAGWALAHPVKAYQAYAWLRAVADRVRRLEARHRPACVLVHYGLLPAMRHMGADALAAVPHVVLHFAPGVPNASVPWVFDGRLRRRAFRLYDPSTSDAVAQSWAALEARVQVAKGEGGCFHRALVHALCWEAAAAPPLVPLAGSGGALEVHRVGSLLDGSLAARFPGAPADLLAFMRANRARVALVTFGSFAGVASLREALPSIVAALVAAGHAVLLHGRFEDADAIRGHHAEGSVFVFDGFLPYAWAVPRLQLCVFTGSACLQNVCLYHRVPMLYVALLTEQCLWAKNYEHMAGVTYLAPHDEPLRSTKRALPRALREALAPRARSYLAAVSAAMRAARRKGAAALSRLVERLVREDAQRRMAGW